MPIGVLQIRDEPRECFGIAIFRNRKDRVGGELVNDDVFHAQRERRVRSFGHRQLQVRFDFRRDLITQIHEPSAEERQRLSLALMPLSRRNHASRLSKNPPWPGVTPCPLNFPAASRNSAARGSAASTL